MSFCTSGGRGDVEKLSGLAFDRLSARNALSMSANDGWLLPRQFSNTETASVKSVYRVLGTQGMLSASVAEQTLDKTVKREILRSRDNNSVKS